MKIKKAFIKLSASVPNVLLLLSILTSSVFFPAIVIAEEIDQLPHTEVVEIIPIEEGAVVLPSEEVEEILDVVGTIPLEEPMDILEALTPPLDESEDILDEGISTGPLWISNGSSSTTSDVVVLGEVYTAPQNGAVSLRFTQLPEESGYLTINEIVLTQEEIDALGAISSTAYDITTDMVDGTYEYSLTLPTTSEDVEVVYAESRGELMNGGTEIEEGISVDGNVVEIEGLDHFTMFIVVDPLPPGVNNGDTCTVASLNGVCYDTLQAAIDASNPTDEIVLRTPTNLGWNIRSKSTTPGERPVDLTCGATTNGDFNTYANGRISHNWELLNAPTNVKYQREWMVPGGSSWTTDGHTYTNDYTQFTSFGSSEGTEGEWNTRVRAWMDIDGDNSPNESVDIFSEWSNDCMVTYDRTSPSITLDLPVQDSLHAGIVDLQATGTEELDYINFWWRAEGQAYSNVSPDRRYHYVYDNGTVFNWNLNTLDAERWGGDPSYPMTDGDYYFYAAGKDIAGNWARTQEVMITVDNTAPEKPTGLEWRDHDGKIYECGDYSPKQALIPDWDDSEDLGFSHYEYSSFHPGGAQGLDEEVFYTSEFVNNWIPPVDGMYGYAVRTVDLAGNPSDWALTEESLAGSCQIISDSIAPKVEVASHNDGDFVSGIELIEGKVSDLNLSHYWFVVEDSAGTTIAGPGVVYKDGPVELPTFKWDTTRVKDGIYTIKLEARDKAGNKDPDQTPVISDPEVLNDSVDWVELTVDNTAPVSTFRPDISNGVFNSAITISGQSVDRSSHVVGVKLYYKPSNESEWKLIEDIKNPMHSIRPTPFNWSYDWTPVQDGKFDIKASAYDALGNEEQSPIMTNITFDTTPPKVGTIHLFHDYAHKYINGFVGFTGRARVKDALSGIDGRTCEYTIDGINWKPATYHPPSGFCTFGIGRLPDAEVLSINVRVTDNAGNLAKGEQLGRTVDAELPDVKVLVREDFYGPQTWTPSGEIIGKAQDSVSNITSVKIRLQRSTDNRYWNRLPGPLNWTTRPLRFHNALGTDTWTYVGPHPTFRNGIEYTITPYAWDQVHIRPGDGNSDSFTWDAQLPQDPDWFNSSHEVDGYSNDDTIEVDFTGAHDHGLSGVKGYYYSFSNTQETPAIDPSNWLDANHAESDSLADGQWWFNIRTMDNVDNITSTAHYGPFNIDTIKPSLQISNPSTGDILGAQFTVDGTAADADSGLNQIRVRFRDSVTNNLVKTCFTPAINNWSRDIGDGTCDVPDGNYKIVVRARDNAGNVKFRNVQDITIDRIPPVVELTSPIDNFYTNQTTVLQTWDTADTDIDFYDYRSCWNNPTVDGTCNQIYSTTRTVKHRTVHNSNITFWWQVRGVDLAGNIGDWADARKITMDSIDPTGSIDSIKMIHTNSGTVYHITEWIINEDLPTIEGLADDERSGVESVSVSIDGTPSTTTITGNAWESAFSIDIPDGPHTITAEIRDNAGNLTTITQDLFVDTVAPRATYIQYNNGTEITDPITFVNNIGQLTFTGDYTDDLPSSELLKDSYVIFQAQDDSSFAFSQNGKLAYCSWRHEPNLVHLNGTTYNDPTERIEFTNCIASLPDGEYYMAHHVYDNAVRKDIPSIHQFRDVLGLHFVVDTIAPVVGITDPADNDFIKGSIDISGFVTDINLSHYNISIYPGGVDVHDFSLRLEGQTVYGPEFGDKVIYTWDTTGYPDGEYQIRLAARDLAGNRELDGDSEHVITVTVDNTVPDRPSGLRRLLGSDHSVVFECGAYSPIQGMHPDWDDSTDTNFDYYEYSSFNAPNGSQGIDERRFDESIFEYNGSWTPDEGTYGFAVRTIDKAGNISDWALTEETLAGSCQITYDDTAPEMEDIIDTLDLLEGEDIPDVLVEVTDDVGLKEVYFELENDDLGTFSDVKVLSGLSEIINVSELIKEYALAYFGENILTIDTFYIPEGEYTVTYNVEDLAGNLSPKGRVIITITNVAPSVNSFTSDVIAITEGETINFEAIFSDPAYIEYPSGEKHADDAPWTYSFLPEGTDSFDDTTMVPEETLTFAHTYINEGTYFAQFEVCEDTLVQGEGECATETIEIEVSNNEPTITIQGTDTAVEGDDPITLTTTLTDGNAPFTYLWSGDCTGTTDSTTFDPTTEGTYSCTVTVTDTDGDIGTDTFDITVEAPPEGDVAGTGDYRYYADGTGSGDALLADSYVPDDEVLGSDDDVQDLLDRINSCETTKKLFGYLYIDKNKDGDKDDNEKVLANVSLKIFIPYNGNEITVKEVTTDENGYWETYLCPGDYNISVNQDDLPNNVDIGDVLAVTVSEDENETQFDIAGIDSRNFWQKYWYIILILLALGVTTGYVILSNKKEE